MKTLDKTKLDTMLSGSIMKATYIETSENRLKELM